MGERGGWVGVTWEGEFFAQGIAHPKAGPWLGLCEVVQSPVLRGAVLCCAAHACTCVTVCAQAATLQAFARPVPKGRGKGPDGGPRPPPLAIADQAGSGKTLAYLLPVVQQLRQEEKAAGGPCTQPGSPRAVVLAPTNGAGGGPCPLVPWLGLDWLGGSVEAAPAAAAVVVLVHVLAGGGGRKGAGCVPTAKSNHLFRALRPL